MNILQEIILHKYEEVKVDKIIITESELEKTPFFNRKVISLKSALTKVGSSGIIAEFKRKSPSKGAFNDSFSVSAITKGYINAGAVALSVLTDKNYFGGSLGDLLLARSINNCPILRKDFMVDEYQILEAKAFGADVILLIAAGINAETVNRLAKYAKSIGLEVLLEVKDASELIDTLSDNIDIVGINNRNLEDFSVDINRSISISAHIPSNFIKISESGISKVSVVNELKQYGFKGFLMGEAFMQTADPIASCTQFISNFNK